MRRGLGWNDRFADKLSLSQEYTNILDQIKLVPGPATFLLLHGPMLFLCIDSCYLSLILCPLKTERATERDTIRP